MRYTNLKCVTNIPTEESLIGVTLLTLRVIFEKRKKVKINKLPSIASVDVK